MPINFQIEHIANNFFACADGQRFFVDRRVPCGSNIGLCNIFSPSSRSCRALPISRTATGSGPISPNRPQPAKAAGSRC